jgi:hypothetical protein
MKLLLLALGVSVLFAAWQWFRPYEWSPDPVARYEVSQCLVERDHSNLWLRVFLKPREGQTMDYLKPIRLTTAAGKQHEPAQMDQAGGAHGGGSLDLDQSGRVDQVVLSFWLEPADFSGPLKLELNGGSVSIRNGDALPKVADGAFRVFNSTRW